MSNVLLCIESRIYREGLEHLLARRDNIDRVEATEDSRQVATALDRHSFDVLLLDMSTKANGADSIERMSEVYRLAKGLPIIVLGFDEADDEVLALIEAGAVAFVHKSDSIDYLAETVEAVARGDTPLPPRMVRLMQQRLTCLAHGARASSSGIDKLSHRERHVLELVAQRLSNKQVARTLGLEVSTVKNHMHNIIVKLGVKSRTEAAKRALAPSLL